MATETIEVGGWYTLVDSSGRTLVQVESAGTDKRYGQHIVYGIISCTNMRDYDGGYFREHATPKQ